MEPLERSAKEYRQKCEEMKRKATIAHERGDEAAKLSYEKLAEGWRGKPAINFGHTPREGTPVGRRQVTAAVVA
jgi:hypothetical protein